MQDKDLTEAGPLLLGNVVSTTLCVALSSNKQGNAPYDVTYMLDLTCLLTDEMLLHQECNDAQ